MTKFKFVGSGTVQNINIAYDGTDIDSIDHVYLYDGNNMLGTGDRDGNYFAFEDINWNINNTKYLTVEADFNIDALTDSTHKFGIEDISSVTGLSAIGSFPIWGESFRIGNTTVSTATIAKVGNPSNPSVGEYADLANFSITNGTNDIALNSISLTQDGTIDNADLTNLELWQGTDKLAEVGTIIDNKINFNLTTPYQIDSNTSCTLTVKGLASGSANETIKIYLASTSDANMEDLQYSIGANVINNYEGETNYSEVTLQGASVTLAFNGPATGQINIAQDQIMMNLAITAADRQVEVKKLSFLLTGDNLETEDTKLFSDIKVRETDSAYSQANTTLMGPQSLCDDGDSQTDQTSCMIDFTDSFFVDANETKYLQLTWDVTDNDYFNGNDKTYHVELLPLTSTSFRYTDDGEYVDTANIAPNEGFVGNDQTVVNNATLHVTLDPSVSSSTVTRPQQNYDFAAFAFTSSNNNTTINSIKLTGYIDDDASGNFSAGISNGISVNEVIQSVKLLDGANQIGDQVVANDDGTVIFNNLSYEIPANTTKVIRVVSSFSGDAPFGNNPDRISFDITDAQTDIIAIDNNLNAVNAVGDASNGGITPNVFVTILSVSNTFPIGEITEATCSYSSNMVTVRGNAYDPDEQDKQIYIYVDENGTRHYSQTDINGDFEISYTPINLSEKNISLYGEDTLNSQYHLLDSQNGIICQDNSLLGTLSVQKNDYTPNSNIVLAGTSNLELGRFDLTATGEDMIVQQLGINIGDDNLDKQAIENVYINYEGNNIAANAFYPDNSADNEAFFGYLAITVPKDNTVTFKIMADLRSMDSNGLYSGKNINVGVNDDIYLQFTGQTSSAIGTVFANHVDGGAEAEGNTMVIHKSKPIISSTTLTNNVLEAGEKEVYKFGLNANNGDYEFGKFILKYAKTGNYNIDSCNVYRDAAIAANGIISTDKISFTFNSSQIISTVPTYIIKCTFSGTFSNNNAFDSFIDADTNYVANDTFQNIAATDANIVWSDLGDSNHLDIGNNSTSSDFTNGYLLESLDHQVLVYTSSEPAAPTVDLKANGSDGPVTINSGDNITMNWTITNATSCTASGSWSGSKNSSGGEETINNVTTDGTYTLQCTGDGGTASDSVTVNVQEAVNTDAGIIFIRGGNIYKISLDGTNEIQLTSGGTDSSPRVSGNVVYFSRTRSGGSHNIWKMKTDGTEVTKLTDDGGNDTDPLLGDGKVFFKSNRVADKDYYYMNTDGGTITAFDPKNNFYFAHIGLGYHNGSEHLVTVSTATWYNLYRYNNLFDVNYLTNTKVGSDYSGTAGASSFIWTSSGNTMIMSCSVDDACGTGGNIYTYNKNDGSKSHIVAGSSPSFSSSEDRIIFVNSSGHISLIGLDGTNEVDLGVSGTNPQYSAL
ncbi:MAG TPA: hypothetical protein PLZ62_01580 [bacterium]|nr:hypothetical protein [bacterium]